MIYTLLFVIILLLLIISYMMIKHSNDKQKFKSKLKILEDFVVSLNQEQQVQMNQLILSDEIKRKLALINTTLNKDIYELNYQLMEDLYPKKEI